MSFEPIILGHTYAQLPESSATKLFTFEMSSYADWELILSRLMKTVINRCWAHLEMVYISRAVQGKHFCLIISVLLNCGSERLTNPIIRIIGARWDFRSHRPRQSGHLDAVKQSDFGEFSICSNLEIKGICSLIDGEN